MVVKTYGSAVMGVDARTITVEVNVSQGQHFYMTGLPDSAVKESQHRVESAIKDLGFYFPRIKVVVNLAPANIRKEGSSYDLPIALAILKASGQIAAPRLHDMVIMGELALDGELRSIKGVLPIAIQSKKEKFNTLIVPKANASEAAIVDNLHVMGLQSLEEAVAFVEDKKEMQPTQVNVNELFHDNQCAYDVDFRDVKGQENIKRALEIAAAGGHNVIMIGPPGAGKTMLSKRLPTILPPLTLKEALETTKIYSVIGKLGESNTLLTSRPFRSPHHTISDVALVGGGGQPQPGEISLSHNGVLFLDELPEFRRSVLEVMRQPMEERKVTISRAKVSVDYPANFILVAGMNPCPCGYYNHPEKECTCASGVVHRYVSRVSGPLLDRIDMHVEVVPISFDQLISTSEHESSKSIRDRVVQARKYQEERFAHLSGVYCNAMMNSAQTKKICMISSAGKKLLKTAMDKLNLSARAYDRILKVSRTIADLGGTPDIHSEHLAEAIQYRSLDRDNWAL